MSEYDRDEDDKLPRDFRSTPEPGISEEQGLLESWEKHHPDDHEVISTRQRGQWSVLIWLVVAALVFMSMFVGMWFILNIAHLTGDPTRVATEIRTNNYILDPAWDYDIPPQRREFHWTVRDHIHNPDGIYRPMILINGQFPGPMIELNEGDTIVVHVDNQAVNATSLHWHGIYQNGTPYMDGTVGVTSCPIPPGGEFTYEFTVSGQSGTYWWHGHHGVQSSDGLHGPFIVHSRDEKKFQQIEYETDRVILVSDHYHSLSSALLWQYLKPDMENAEPVPDGALINGRAIKNCDNFTNRKCDNGSSYVGIPSIQLEPDQKHRLRFINIGAFAEFQLQIDEHELAVTEVDGTDVVPSTYHRLNISPAQRYSVVISTNMTNSDKFWLRARMITQCFTDPPRNLESEVRAIVYFGEPSSDDDEHPTSMDWNEQLDLECKDMNSSELVPVVSMPAPSNADAFFYLRSNFEIGAYRLSRGFFNSTSWRPNARSPTLFRSVDGITTENVTFMTSKAVPSRLSGAFINDVAFDQARELVVQTTGIQTIDILVSNFDDGNHPLHLHGYKYFVLAQGHGYPPLAYTGADINPANLAPLYDSLDLTNPLRRDTASVEGFGWILLRLVADNPGAWAFHCHLSWHSEAGLLMQFLTRSEELGNVRIPQSSLQLCAAAGLEKGMGPEDADYEDLAK